VAQRLVYHWKHGWIPLDHYAALKKAHGSEGGAAKLEKAPDHLVLYHGTHAKHVEGIRKSGLRQAINATAQSYTLTTSKEQAAGYAAGHEKDAAVVEFHVPLSEIRVRGVDNEAALWEKTTEHNVYGVTGTAHALRRTLPAKYVAAVHYPNRP
jgi:hypothetical protein